MDIKKYFGKSTYVMQRKSFFDKNIKVCGNLIVGNGACFWGNLSVSELLELGKNSEIYGNVFAKEAVIGANSLIEGDVTVESDLTVLDGARITGILKCGGNVFLRPNVAAKRAEVKGDIEMHGKNAVPHIKVNGKIIAKKDR